MEIRKVGINSNPINEGAKRASSDNAYRGEINYTKGLHPNEALGRSSVKFTGLKPEIPSYGKEEFFKLLEEDGIVTGKFLVEIKEKTDENNSSKMAFLYQKIKESQKGFYNPFKPDIIHSALTSLNDDNFDFLNKVAEISDVSVFNFENTNLIGRLAPYAVDDNSDFFVFLLKWQNPYRNTVISSFLSPDNKSNRDDVVQKSIEQGKIIKQIETIEETDEEAKNNKQHLYWIYDRLNADNVNFAVKLAKLGSIYYVSKIPQNVSKEAEALLDLLIENKDTLNVHKSSLAQIITVDDTKTPEEKSAILNARLNILKAVLSVPKKENATSSQIGELIKNTNSANYKLALELVKNGYTSSYLMPSILLSKYSEPEKNDELIDKKLALFKKYNNKIEELQLVEILSYFNLENADLLNAVLGDENIPRYNYRAISNCGLPESTDEEKKECFDFRFQVYKKLKENPDGYNYDILSVIDVWNLDFAKSLINDNIVPLQYIYNTLYVESVDEDVISNTIKLRAEFYNELKANPDLDGDTIGGILRRTNEQNIDFLRLLISDKDFPKDKIDICVKYSLDDEIEEKTKLYHYMSEKGVSKDVIADILYAVNHYNIQHIYTLLDDDNFPDDKIAQSMYCPEYEDITKLDIRMNMYNKLDGIADTKVIAYALPFVKPENAGKIENLLWYSKQKELTAEAIANLLDEKIDYRQYQKAVRTFGLEKLESLNEEALNIYVNFQSVYGKGNINEIPIYEKRDFLRALVASNQDLFNLSDDIRNDFPLLPKNAEQYCSLMPSIVKSLGIETNEITDADREHFETCLFDFSDSLKNLSDADFNGLNIGLEYSKDDFIYDVLQILEDVPKAERQKVYDYFGFELHKNKKTKTGFSIYGYPMNLNNGKKLAQITDPKTKEIVEKLRPCVIKFSQSNQIKCDNPVIKKQLDEITRILPELIPQIDKIQAGMNGTKGSHSFDVLKHSLKVMQKIVQNPEYNSLNTSDKKIMLLASLLHDITKKEAYGDRTHPDEGSFDAFYIARKLNLTKEEQIKLHTLIKHHEWFGRLNRTENGIEFTKMLQSTAYDLRDENLFDMSVIFTHADLRAVKTDDSFHDKKDGKGRRVINNQLRSFGETLDIYAGKPDDDVNSHTVRGYINELKKSQPIMPTTKIPSTSEIEKAITVVNPDGSTNIKGVYKNEKGLIIIKYNEVEDFEAIGFPSGSISKGIETVTDNGKHINTGNIHFFVHALDYPNQLAKFDAFSLPDSDALLSASYAECPESKYRFFRPQGVILDVDTKDIHGGGESDSGSGFGKNIDDFKKDYLFGGSRQNDRLFVSNLIKEALNINDDEYLKFVEENKNKKVTEIEPVEIRNKIIKAFASINSNNRKGDRSYNEFYISNPKPPMAVFAYNVDTGETIKNPVEFLNRCVVTNGEKQAVEFDEPISVNDRTKFLQEYALLHNVPFIIFGD